MLCIIHPDLKNSDSHTSSDYDYDVKKKNKWSLIEKKKLIQKKNLVIINTYNLTILQSIPDLKFSDM